MTDHISESGSLTVTVIGEHAWSERKAAIAAEGERKAKELREAGHAFKVEILAPNELDDQTPVRLAAVNLDLDWKLAIRLKMVEDARNLLTKAVMVEALDPSLPPILSAIIEGKGLYEHGIGEFFLLYGRFEQKHGTSGKKTCEAMLELVNGCRDHMKLYVERGKERLDPLPFAVRNILAHSGTNPNTLDKEGLELRTSIELLQAWLR